MPKALNQFSRFWNALSLTDQWIVKQDGGRLAPVQILPNYKYFDQLLQTVKNETTVLNLVFKAFL